MLSSVSLLTAIVVGIFIFAVGYFWGMFQKARGGYRGAKTGVPKARKAYYSALWVLIKWAAAAAFILIALMIWTVNDVSNSSDTAPAPSTSASVPRR
jgi:H+/Cl- antiporter ClcA